MRQKKDFSKQDFEGVDHAQDWDVSFNFKDYFRLRGYVDGPQYTRSFELTVSEADENASIIAIATGDFIQFELAATHGYPFEEISEFSSADNRCLPRTYHDHLGMNPWLKLDAHYKDRPRLNRNILVVDRLDILPKFRGYGIGGTILKYMAELLYQNCGLMLVQVLPSQHRVHFSFFPPNEDWEKALELHNLEKDPEMAKYKLMGLAIKMGFENPFGMDHVIAPMDTMALDWKLDLSRMPPPIEYDDNEEEFEEDDDDLDDYL
jgi:GNAT superfamily N-acetyltransferase